MNVSKIILKLFYFLKILNILTILIDLTILADEAPSIYKIFSKIIPIIEIKETTRSKMLKLSLKYLFPNPIILKIASSMKNDENT
jgi:hypothetical protein